MGPEKTVLLYQISLYRVSTVSKVIQNIIRGAVVAQWMRPQTLNCEVPGSNLLAAAVVPLGKALYPHCLVPRKGL